MTRVGIDLLCLKATRLSVECSMSKTTLRVNNPVRQERAGSPGPESESLLRLPTIFVHSIKWTLTSLGSDTWLEPEYVAG